jgi:hypothetical protein
LVDENNEDDIFDRFERIKLEGVGIIYSVKFIGWVGERIRNFVTRRCIGG